MSTLGSTTARGFQCWSLRRIAPAVTPTNIKSSRAAHNVLAEKIALAWLVEIDGKPFSILASQTFELAPGRHTVAIAFKERLTTKTVESIEPCDVDFVAEAGHHYAVVVRVQHLYGVATWQASLQDQETRQESACVARNPVEWEWGPTGEPRPILE